MKKELQPQINWDIHTKDVIIENAKETRKMAILRNDTNELLGIVGQDYCPFTNEKLMAFAHALTSSGEFELKGFDEFNSGKTILAFLQNKNSNLKISGCAMQEYLILGNSHDGTKPFYIGTGSTLIRCENQFFSSIKIFRKKHTAPINIEQLNVPELISIYKSKKSTINENFEGMESIRVDQSVVNRLIKEIQRVVVRKVTSASKDSIDKSPSMIALRQCIQREMNDLGNNLFGLFNGVTYYTSHQMRNAGADFGRLTGSGNEINQIAFRFCKKIKNASLKAAESNYLLN